MESNVEHARAIWEAALDDALAHFRALLGSSNSRAWTPVVLPSSATSSSALPHPRSSSGSLIQLDVKGKGRASSFGVPGEHPSGAVRGGSKFKLGALDAKDVKLHRRSGRGSGGKSGKEILRAVVDVPYEGKPDAEDLAAVLETCDAREAWDRMVESSELLDLLDPRTRICKTDYRFGWPASPRDVITISRTISDARTVVDVSTSLPRSRDEPPYLRPAPPYVRSHLHLLAWCVQILDPSEPEMTPAAVVVPLPKSPCLRITAFWSWDLKGFWTLGGSGLAAQFPALLCGFADYVRDHSDKIPTMRNYGRGVEITSRSYDHTRDTLLTGYSVLPYGEGDGHTDESPLGAENATGRTTEDLANLQWRRLLDGSVEFTLPSEQGWDVKVDVRSSTTGTESSDWRSVLERPSTSGRISLVVKRSRFQDVEESVKVRVSIQRIASSKEVRLNGKVQQVSEVEARSPTAVRQMLADVASTSGFSLATTSSADSSVTDGPAGSSSAGSTHVKRTEASEGTSTPTSSVVSAQTLREQTASPKVSQKRAVAQAIATLIRRNYIYFTSLLQEPEAKWKHISESRGVTITKLDSIDPTLVVYRAEATFVGVGVWDLFSTINTPGVRAWLDGGREEATLLEDVSDLSSLWHLKKAASWPASARDSVLVKTSYKSPNSVHIFSFSTDDHRLFPTLPPTEAGVIRVQVDLLGWSVESLSPNTTHITLLEQSDPKGWTSKSTIPSQMITAVAGVGDYAIKFGGPPVATRLLGAKANSSKYDHEKAQYRIEYAALQPRLSEATADDEGEGVTERPNIECELRCDVETWAQSLDVVVDPPPTGVSCLRRHRLSSGGGGLWITVEHNAAALASEPARVIVRRGPSPSRERDRGMVLVNGAKVKVDRDDLPADEVKLLSQRKRTKPTRIALDQPVARKPWQKRGTDSQSSSIPGSPDGGAPTLKALGDSNSTSLSSWGRFFGIQTTSNLNASLDALTGEKPAADAPRHPMCCALDALAFLQIIHAGQAPDPASSPPGWAPIFERNGLVVRRKMFESISPTVAVHRGDKVIEGLSADEIAAVVTSPGCRSKWDEKYESYVPLESYGNGASTAFVTTKATFPFRGRGFHIASTTARAFPPSSVTSPTGGAGAITSPSIIYHASASFPEVTADATFNTAELNPQNLPIGKVLVEGWILETLDPYGSSNYPIPSTRCTFISAIDYGGSLPLAVNTMYNASLPRGVLAVEELLKGQGLLPMLKRPWSSFQVALTSHGEDTGDRWEVAGLGRRRQLLFSNFSTSNRAFQLSVKLRRFAEGDKPRRNSESNNASATPSSPPSMAPQVFTDEPQPVSSLPLPSAPSSTDGSLAMRRQSSSRTLSHTKSTASLKPHGSAGNNELKNTPSLRDLAGEARKRARDLIVAEVEVDLKHYPAGYEITAASTFLRASEKPGADIDQAAEDEAIDLSQLLGSSTTGASELPLLASVYELPTSALRAASLDAPVRGRKHLVRLALPTARYSPSVPDPLSGSQEDERQEPPEWYQKLARRGATVNVSIRPSREGEELEGIAKPIQVTIRWQGEKVGVTSEQDTADMLAREARTGSEGPKLVRTRAKDLCAPDIPVAPPSGLEQPLAANARFKHRSPSKVSGSSSPNEASSPPVLSRTQSRTSTSTADDESKAISAGASRPGRLKVGHGEAKSGASTPLMSLFSGITVGAYPLSRFTSVPAAEGSRPTNGHAEGAVVDPSSSGADPKADKTDGSETTMPGGSSALLLRQSRERRQARSYSTMTVVLVALIFFLLGSFLRSLLSPADFLLQGPPSEMQGLVDDGQEIRWREIRRLLEFKGVIGGRDLVVAVVRRQ